MAFNRLLNSIDHDFIFNAHYPSARRCIFTYKKGSISLPLSHEPPSSLPEHT
ncbi:unnamed protein product [Brassica rapa subsp. trilocularis]